MYKIARQFTGAIVLFAVFVQYLDLSQKSYFNPANYFSYLTILSSIFLALIYIFNFKRSDSFRGASTLYISLVGFGFTFLLGGKNDLFLGWVNIILHYIAPCIALLDWFTSPRIKIIYKESILWIMPLVFYFIYTMIRGELTAWYPYSIINPSEVGIIGVITNALIMLFGALLFNLILTRPAVLDLAR